MQRAIMWLSNNVQKHSNIQFLKKIPAVQKLKKFLEKKRAQMCSKHLNKYGYNILQACFEAIERMDKNVKPRVWIDYGTLLGFVRNGCLIEHDNDLDIGCTALKPEMRMTLIGEFKKSGLQHVRSFSIGDMPIIDSFLMNDIILDLGYYYESNNSTQLISYIFSADERTQHSVSGQWHIVKGMKVYRIISEAFDVVSGKFNNGTSVMVPIHPIEILLAEYGINWRIPNKNWNWEKEMPCESLGFQPEFHGKMKA